MAKVVGLRFCLSSLLFLVLARVVPIVLSYFRAES